MKPSKDISEADESSCISAANDNTSNKYTKTESINIDTTIEPYNLADLYLLSRGNEKFIEKMVKIFIEQMPAQVTKMEDYYKQQQYKEMGAVAHFMKPALDSMGIISLKDIIREIEVKGKNEMFDGAMSGSITELRITIDKVVNLLKTKFKK